MRNGTETNKRFSAPSLQAREVVDEGRGSALSALRCAGAGSAVFRLGNSLSMGSSLSPILPIQSNRCVAVGTDGTETHRMSSYGGPMHVPESVSKRSVELNSATLVILESGTGGSPLLLVHGITGSKEDFGPAIPALVELGYHVVAPDLRGHGESTHDEDEQAYGIDHFKGDLVELADLLDWEQFDLVGHSMGGMIAQRLILAHPERVARLVLMSTHHGVVENYDQGLIALGAEMARTHGLEAVHAVLEMGYNPNDNPAYERVCAEVEGYREWASTKMLRCSSAMYASMLSQFPVIEDRLEQLTSISVPTLVQVGDLDTPFVGASERMAATIPGAALDRFSDACHMPQFEARADWERSLHRFLGAATA